MPDFLYKNRTLPCLLILAALLAAAPCFCLSQDDASVPARPVLVLDPGHGGPDKGSTAGRLYEKDLALNLAMMVRDALGPAYGVVLTRDKDVALSLDERTGAANNLGPDLLVSIHCSARWASGDNFMDIIFWGPAQEKVQEPSKTKEDKPAQNLSYDRLQTSHAEQSRLLAESLAGRLQGLVPGFTARAVALPAAVLAGADMNAVLVDIPMDLARGKDSQARLQAVAKAISAGISEFLPAPTAPSEPIGLTNSTASP